MNMKILYFINGDNYRIIHYNETDNYYSINDGKHHEGKPTEYIQKMVRNGWVQTNLRGYIVTKYNLSKEIIPIMNRLQQVRDNL